MTYEAPDPAVLKANTLKQVHREREVLDRRVASYESAVLAAFDAGCSLRQIAEVAGITHAGVDKLVKRVRPTA